MACLTKLITMSRVKTDPEPESLIGNTVCLPLPTHNRRTWDLALAPMRPWLLASDPAIQASQTMFENDEAR